MQVSGLRHYSPSLGRWANRDPLGENGGVNTSGFSANDPVCRFDVLGRWWTWPVPGYDDCKCCCAEDISWAYDNPQPYFRLFSYSGPATPSSGRVGVPFTVKFTTSAVFVFAKVASPNCQASSRERFVHSTVPDGKLGMGWFDEFSQSIAPGASPSHPDEPSVKIPPLPARHHLQIEYTLKSSTDPACKCAKAATKKTIDVDIEYNGSTLTKLPPISNL